MRPIYLQLLPPSDTPVAPCGSRFWGNPDLPRGYGYPSYCDAWGDPCEYQFVCQLNLTEVAPFDSAGRLPHRGLLSFFARIDHYLGRFDCDTPLGGHISDPSQVCVLYFPEVGEAGPRRDFDELVLLDEADRPFNPRELPIRYSLAPQADRPEEHALFAAPTHREWEGWDPPCEDWEILLQVDSFDGADFHLNFMDCGVLAFLIDPSDLACRRFDRVRAIVLST